MKSVSREENGFTMIELMVVVLIIAILVGLAIPTFLGARRRAQDSQAKSHLRGALVAQKTYFASALSYTDDSTRLGQIEPALAWGSVDASARGVVVEHVSSNMESIVLKSLSRSATLFCLADSIEAYPSAAYTSISEGGTWYTRRDNASSSSDCTGLLWETTSAGWS